MSISELDDAMRCMERMNPTTIAISNPRWYVCYRLWQRLRAAELGQTVEQTFGDRPSNG
jgi:hypothetical protein